MRRGALLAASLVGLLPATARAQQPMGPQPQATAPVATQEDIERLRDEMRQREEATLGRTDADEAAIMRLHLALDEEHRARLAAEAALREQGAAVTD